MTTEPGDLAELAASAERTAAVRDAAQGVLDREWDLARTRALLDAEDGAWAPELWATMTELGWDDLLVTESAGGGGGSVADLCAIAEVVGVSTAPTPLVLAAAARGALAGAEVGGLVVLGDAAPVDAKAGSAGWIASGHLPIVPFGDVASELLLLLDDGRDQALARLDLSSTGVERAAVRTLDRLPSAAIDLDGVSLPDETIVATGDAATELWSRAQGVHTVGTIAELLGVVAGANERATEYACHRETFGRPIGSYQAIKHRLVDQRCAIEVARALVVRAALALDDAHVDAAPMVALAAFWAVGELRSVAEGALQVFGGIGYTWEHDAHLALRRGAVLTALLGPRAKHRATVGRWLEQQ